MIGTKSQVNLDLCIDIIMPMQGTARNYHNKKKKREKERKKSKTVSRVLSSSFCNRYVGQALWVTVFTGMSFSSSNPNMGYLSFFLEARKNGLLSTHTTTPNSHTSSQLGVWDWVGRYWIPMECPHGGVAIADSGLEQTPEAMS